MARPAAASAAIEQLLPPAIDEGEEDSFHCGVEGALAACLA